MAVESVKACIPELERAGAEQLVALAGGEFGDLAGKAMQLCGLQFVHDFARGKIDEALHPKTLTEAANEGGEWTLLLPDRARHGQAAPRSATNLSAGVQSVGGALR